MLPDQSHPIYQSHRQERKEFKDISDSIKSKSF